MVGLAGIFLSLAPTFFAAAGGVKADGVWLRQECPNARWYIVIVEVRAMLDVSFNLAAVTAMLFRERLGRVAGSARRWWWRPVVGQR